MSVYFHKPCEIKKITPPQKNGFIDEIQVILWNNVSVRSSTCVPHQWTLYSLTE